MSDADNQTVRRSGTRKYMSHRAVFCLDIDLPLLNVRRRLVPPLFQRKWTQVRKDRADLRVLNSQC